MLRVWELRFYPTGLIDLVSLAVHCGRVGPCAKCFNCARDSSRQKKVIGVEPSDYRSPCKRESFVNSMRLPAIGFRDERKAIEIWCDDACRIVGRAAIHHDILDVRIILRKNAFDGCANKTPLIV